MSFFHKKNVTKCLGHHYAIWTSDSNFLLAHNFCFGPTKAGPHFRHCYNYRKNQPSVKSVYVHAQIMANQDTKYE